MVHTVHAAEGRQDVGVGAYPAEGPADGAVAGTHGLELLLHIIGHLAQGTAAQRFHDDALHARLLTFIVEVLGIGIATASSVA